ncbi:aldo/keto reductase [Cellulosimicrobium arenosum]|uniref:Aldo/keto reductase n=1 Tax=Cellulosimicrobium arenosum TaxID=2708133 RepID=A0A927J1W9_9MICO|nr:aldo/keto reductase [Cellulosimicrobium arenosum]MBD8080409.1 aldo/keto reductase [Cellulosimicrobium arenosum]
MRTLDIGTRVPASVIGLGTWQFGSKEWGYGDDFVERAGEIVRRALDLGVTFFDSAELYGFGRSERILGEALGDRREDAVVATKIFPLLPVAPVVEQRAVASADRLGVQRLDLYQVHQANPVVRDGTTMRGMAALQRTGLVDQVGVSNYPLQRWQEAELALGGPVMTNQVQYSLVHRDPEQDLLPWAREQGRVVVAYSPLGQGVLSGRYTPENRPQNSVRRANPLFWPENLERVVPLVDALREVGDAHDLTPAQAALAWVVARPGVLAIPGASSVEQLEKNVEAGSVTLAEDEVAALDHASAAFRPVGLGERVRSSVRSRLSRAFGDGPLVR